MPHIIITSDDKRAFETALVKFTAACKKEELMQDILRSSQFVPKNAKQKIKSDRRKAREMRMRKKLSRKQSGF